MTRLRSRVPLPLVLIAALTLLPAASGSSPAAAAPPGGDACVALHTGYTDGSGDPTHVYDANGREVGLLPSAAGLAPDGSGRVYVSHDLLQVRYSKLDGSGDRLLHDLTGSEYEMEQWAKVIWGGDRIAFLVNDTTVGYDRRQRLATIDISTGAFRVIDPALPVVAAGYDLSADGSKVVYADASGVFRGSHIWVAGGDGSNRLEIVHDPKSDSALPPYIPPKSVTELRFSPDGSQIAYSGRDGISNGVKFGPSHELWLVNSDGSGFREIAGIPVNNRSKHTPVWSADGTRIAYGWSLNGESWGMAVVDVGSNVTTDLPGIGGLLPDQASRPLWSETADTIFLTGAQRTAADYDNGLFAVRSTGGAPAQALSWEGTAADRIVGLVPCGAVPASAFAGLTPARILDTRNGVGAPVGKLGQGASLTLPVLGRGGVPASGVDAVALNVTAANTTASSYLTVWPSGQPRPNASNVNWAAGATVPNAVVVKIGAGGSVDVFNAFGATDVLVDVVGWFASGPGFSGITPTRLLDTRSGIGAPAGKLGQAGELGLQVTGDAIPATATGVILNATATEPSATGYVTVYPSGTGRPETSSLNMPAGVTVANLVVSSLGTDGQVRMYNAFGETHLIADAAGYFAAGSGFTGITPTRVIDTRQSGSSTGTGRTTEVRVAGLGTNVPTNARSVVVNVTAVDPTEAGYLTVFPSGVARPEASNLNFVAGQTVPNLVFAQIGTDRSISIYNATGRTHVIVDIVGWFA